MQVLRKVQGVFKGDVSKVPKPVYGSDSVVFDSTPSGSTDPSQQRPDRASITKALSELEQALLRQSRQWSKDYADFDNDPEWKSQFRRSSKHWAEYCALLEQRKSILVDVDGLLVRVSCISGAPAASESADAIRACLAKKPDEEKHLLESWRMGLPR